MPAYSDDLAFRVDFNNIGANALLKGTVAHASSHRTPNVGERVFLHDWEGNRCFGWVQRVRGNVVYFIIDDATWVSGEEVEMSGTVASAPSFAIAS